MTCIEFADSMSKVLSWMSKLLNVDIEYWQIDCNTKKTTREKIINNFKQSTKISIIINVHILDEGINIPECDSVFITQPSNNMINIIQRMCRANRIVNNKMNCNIYLWCKERKTKIILNHIYNNTDGFIKDKVFIYNTENKIIKKHIIERENLDTNAIIQTNTTDFLKKYSQINYKFINDFYSIYNKTNNNKHIIDLDIVSKWLDTRKRKLKETLVKSYNKNIDYVLKKEQTGKISKINKEIILLTPDCFKRMCLLSRTKKAEEVRTYYLELEKLLNNYIDLDKQKISKND
jgi:phage anti-repressor protein